MIKIRLLGSARKAAGRDIINLDLDNASIKDVIEHISKISGKNISISDLLVAINGVELSMLGTTAKLKDGDTVTLVPVVHGG